MLQELENQLDNQDKYLRYLTVKTEIENIQKVKTDGILLRSKTQWIDQGERNSKYFLNLEKRNYNIKYIKKIVTADGSTVVTPNDILREQSRFYSNLYTSKLLKQGDDALQNCKFFNTNSISQLNIEEQHNLESKLTISDLTKALDTLPNNKSPGLDGFTTEFYKCFWIYLQQPLYNSYIYSFNKGYLSDGQRRGLLSLIPKPQKDLRFLKSWRPISLLATDYKLLTKALSMKLQMVIPNLINSDQVGYIKGRNICENVRIIDDIMVYTKLNKISGFLTLVDFEKAFDTIEWSFLFKTLQCFNFGEHFIKWIQLLYGNISSCVSNIGYLSNYFSLTRGIRQGCPLSAFLFILVAEVLAINIREDNNIEGLNILDQHFKISQMADDTTLYLKNINALKRTVSIFKDFKMYSGLNLNLEKT